MSQKKYYLAYEELEKHTLMSWQEGEEIVFNCQQCGFTRRLNYATGKLSTVHQGDPEALHYGAHQPSSWQGGDLSN